MNNAATTKTAETTTQRLDRLTKAATAFDSWDELVTAINGGYMPTLYTRRNGKVRPNELSLVAELRWAGLPAFAQQY